MYIPQSFAEPRADRLHAFLASHSFATLISGSGGALTANHIPLLLDADRGPQGTLVGHLARANDQWRTAANQPVLAVFQGPHAYVSPTWYEEPNVVPTWNYIAVHASGTLRVREDPEWLRALLERTVDAYEASRPQPWRIDHEDAAFLDRLMQGIVGFEIEIQRLEGKWKLSQNHSAARRSRVIQQWRATGRADELALADWMQATLTPQ